MSRPRSLTLAAVLLSALLFSAGPVAIAAAGTPAAVRDCQANHGKLTHTYTPAQLHAALNALPPGVQEYTACYAAIQNQLSADTGVSPINGGGGSGGGSSSGTVIIIIVAAIIVLGGGGAALWAQRRNRAAGDQPS